MTNPMNDQPLKIEHDKLMDLVTIEGINYSGHLFREWGTKGMPEGTHFKLHKREDGVLTLERIDSTRIKLGPIELACKKCGTKDTFVLDIENPNTAITGPQ